MDINFNICNVLAWQFYESEIYFCPYGLLPKTIKYYQPEPHGGLKSSFYVSVSTVYTGRDRQQERTAWQGCTIETASPCKEDRRVRNTGKPSVLSCPQPSLIKCVFIFSFYFLTRKHWPLCAYEIKWRHPHVLYVPITAHRDACSPSFVLYQHWSL